MDLTSKGPKDTFKESSATGDPSRAEERQLKNKTWWEENPMRYDWKEDIPFREHSEEFFRTIDRRFFSDVKVFMPWKYLPFDPLIDYETLEHKKVLEIGVGNGSMAELLASHAEEFVGIDITEYAVESTRKRLQKFEVDGSIYKMDAENLSFEDNTFDFIWGWGVIHHSSDPIKILREMNRVLNSDGQAITMVYQKNWWNYYVIGGLFRGILQGKLFSGKNIDEILQESTDGAMARFYNKSSWERLVEKYFQVKETLIYGTKQSIMPLPGGDFKSKLAWYFPDVLSRFLTNTCGMGTFLVTKLSPHEAQ